MPSRKFQVSRKSKHVNKHVSKTSVLNPILEAIIVLATKQREMHYESVVGGRRGVLTKASSHGHFEN